MRLGEHPLTGGVVLRLLGDAPFIREIAGGGKPPA